jgi:hypothetical protein
MMQTNTQRKPEEKLPGVEDPPQSGLPAAPAGTNVATYDLGEDAGAGTEDMRMEEQLTPFLRILQKGSPQVDEESPEHMPGAKPGMLFDTATQETYDGKAGVQVLVAVISSMVCGYRAISAAASVACCRQSTKTCGV